MVVRVLSALALLAGGCFDFDALRSRVADGGSADLAGTDLAGAADLATGDMPGLGTTWRSVPSGLDGGQVLNGVWGDATGDQVWVAGTPDHVRRSDNAGASWNMEPLPSLPGGTVLQAMWGSADHLFIVGDNGVILHKTAGNPWLLEPTSPPTIQDFHAVWGNHPTDVWAVGAMGMAAHRDGSNWTIVASGPSTGYLESVFVSGGVVLAGGDEGNKGAIYSWNGAQSAWTKLTTPFATGQFPWTLWVFGGLDYWAGTDNPTHYFAGWKNPLAVNLGDCYGSWARRHGELYMAGQNGFIVRIDGVDALSYAVEHNGANHLEAIWGGTNRMWAVGRGGTVLTKP
jgi:hypothetical protein